MTKESSCAVGYDYSSPQGAFRSVFFIFLFFSFFLFPPCLFLRVAAGRLEKCVFFLSPPSPRLFFVCTRRRQLASKVRVDVFLFPLAWAFFFSVFFLLLLGDVMR